MQQTNFKVYGYRWIMLSAYMFIAAVNQLMWITFAPITSDATRYYGVSDLKIGILSMCFYDRLRRSLNSGFSGYR